MNYWGKIIGVLFGYLIGGVVGAALGLAIGYILDKGAQGKQVLKFTRLDPLDLVQIRPEFLSTTFSVLGHLAQQEFQLGGRGAEEQVLVAKHVMDRMGVREERRGDALRLFNEGLKPDFPLQTVVGQLYLACKNELHVMEMFIELLIYAAHYHGKINPLNKQTILTICYQIDMGNGDYNRIERLVKAEYQSPAPKMPGNKKKRRRRGKNAGLEAAYELLNTTPQSSDDEVKAAYRRLTSKNHPDKLVAQGMSDDVLKLAEEKTRLIRAAYERIREVRDF